MHRAYSLDWSPNALSPTSQTNALRQNLKKVAQLKEELHTEISEKNELLEENTSLKKTVENLNQKLKCKSQETEKLKDDLQDLQLTFERNSENLTSRCSSENETAINNLKIEISELKKYIVELEAENESAKRALERCEQKCSKMTDEYVTMESHYDELRSNFQLNLEKIEQLQQSCRNMKMELSDLKECNQVLKEENMRLESRSSSFSENSECLERELQFQFMKDEIERMTNNLETIEDQQSKLISANVDLTKEKADLLQKQQSLQKENEEAKSQNEELGHKIASLNEENESLKNLAGNFESKLQIAEKLLRDREQRLEFLMKEYKAVEDKLHAERAELQQKYDELTRNNCQLILQLEAEINEKEDFKIALQRSKTKLEAKEVEYEVLVSKHTELTSNRNQLADLLQKNESELSSLQSTQAKIENELTEKVNLVNDLEANLLSLNEKYEKLTFENEELVCNLSAVNDELLVTKDEAAILKDKLFEVKADREKIAQENHSLAQCNKNLNEEIERTSSLNCQLQDELENRVSELKQVSAELNALEHEYVVLKAENSKLIETLRQENQEFKSKNSDLLKSNQECSDTIQNLQSQIQNLQSAKEAVSKKLQSCEMKYVNSMKDFHQKLEAASKKQNALTGKSETLLAENTSLQSRLGEAVKDKEAYESQVKLLDEKFNELVVSKDLLSQELAKLESNHTESVEKLQKELEVLSLEIESLSSKNQILEKDSAILRATISSMTEKELILQQNLKVFSEQMAKMEQELSSALDEKEVFSAASTELAKENTELIDQIRISSKSTNLLEKQLEEADQVKKALFKEKEELQVVVEKLEKQVDDFRSSNSTLAQKLKENEIAFAEKLEQLQQNLNRAQQEFEVQQKCNERLLEENATLASNIADITQQSELLHEQLKRFEEDTSVLSLEKQDYVLKIKTLEEEVRRVMQTRDGLAEKLRHTEESLQEKVSSLQEELSTALHDGQLQFEKAASLMKENAALQNQLSKLSSVEQTLQEQLKQLSDEKSGAVDRCNGYIEDVKKLQVEVEDLVISKRFLSEEISAKEIIHAQKIEALSTQLETILREKETCAKHNAELVEQNTLLENKMTELVEEAQLVRQQLAQLEDEKAILLETEAQHSNAIKNLEERVKNLSSENSTLSEELRLKKAERARIESEFEDKLKQVSEKRDCLAKSNALLVNENGELKNRVCAVERESQEVQQQLKEFQEEKTRALNELREMLLHQIDQLQKANDDIREENHHLVEKNAEKLFCLKEVERRFETLTQEMNELKSKCDGLQATNDELQHKVEECKQNETRLRDENTQLKEVINEAKTGRDGLLLQIEVLTGNEERLNRRLQEVTKEIEEAKLDQRELRRVISVESHSNEALKQVNTELLSRIDHLEAEKEKLLAEIQELGSNADSLKQERKSDFQKLEQENVKLKTRLEELTAQKEELYKMEKINKDVFENQLQSFTTKNQGLQGEVNKLQDLIDNMDADMITLKEKIERSESVIKQLQSSKEEEKLKLTTALEDEKKRFSNVSTRLESFVKENETILKQLEAEKRCAHNLVQTYETKLQKEAEARKSLESKLQNVESCEIESLKRRIEELKCKLDEVVEENECLAENSKMKTNHHELLLKENENLMQKIDQLEKQMVTVEKEYDQLLEEKEENRKLSDDMSMQLKNLRELLEGKDKEIIRLSDEYNVFKEEYRKLVEHKGQLDKEFQETLLQENAKLSKKCDELSDANLKFVEQLAEKAKIIESLRANADGADSNSSADEKLDLNQTRVVASGPDNEIYMKLRHENIKLVEERDNYKKQLTEMAQQLDKEKEAYRGKAQNLYSKISTKMIAEYEGKLERAKAEYQKIIKQKYSLQESEWKKREEEYKLMLKKEKEHIRDLSSQMWDISDKYLQLKQKLETKTSPLKFRTYSEETLFSPSTLSRRTKSATQLNLIGSKGYRVSDFDRRLSTMSEDLPPPMRRRQTLTISGKKFSLSSAKVFPTEDEEQEIFDNACLSDLKQGRMNIDDSNDFSKQRLSILQQRNSLCPPHLKSSYPAETQFIPPQEFREHDIKMGVTGENDKSDIENLIPRDARDSLRKKGNQTSYKKPGPPTPSKNGGRTIQSEHSVTPRNILKESNDNGNSRRKSFTPKFLNNLFALRGHATVTIPQDENISTTPRQNRLSSIRRRFSRNAQELGNTNSGFC